MLTPPGDGAGLFESRADRSIARIAARFEARCEIMIALDRCHQTLEASRSLLARIAANDRSGVRT